MDPASEGSLGRQTLAGSLPLSFSPQVQRSPDASALTWIQLGFVSVCLALAIVFRECPVVGCLIPISWRRTTSIISQRECVRVKGGTVTPPGRERFRFNAVMPASRQAGERQGGRHRLQPRTHVPAVGWLVMHVRVVDGRHIVGARRVHGIPGSAEDGRFRLEAAGGELGVLAERRLPGRLAQGGRGVARLHQVLGLVEEERVHVVVAERPRRRHRHPGRTKGEASPGEIMKLQISCNNLVFAK